MRRRHAETAPYPEGAVDGGHALADVERLKVCNGLQPAAMRAKIRSSQETCTSTSSAHA